MQELLEKRHTLESDLRALEKQIYELETTYIEETQNTGNVIKGWDGFLANKGNKASQYPGGIKKLKPNPNERVFSLSSYTSPAAKALEDESDRSVINGAAAASLANKRNKKKKNYTNYTDLIYNKEPKRDEIFGYDDDDRGNDSGEYRAGAKTPTNAKGKSERKKSGKKIKIKSKKT